MNKKNRGFSLFLAVVTSLILTGVSVGIISFINKSLEQTNNIARSNQLFFAAESGKEAALFHHGVRGGGINIEAKYDAPPADNLAIPHDNIGANVGWEIEGRVETTAATTRRSILEGKIHENEKITIPLYWDPSTKINQNIPTTKAKLDDTQRKSLQLQFLDTVDMNFDFGTNTNDVLIVWSVSRINGANSPETFIPITPTVGEPCATDSSFFCKSDLCQGSCAGLLNFTNGIINFNSSIKGKILPTSPNAPTDLDIFMGDANSSNYEISFQPILPFTSLSTPVRKISSLDFKITTNLGNLNLPKNTYDITTTVDFGNFVKSETTKLKEKPAIGVFDYIIFK